jgi:UDP:flavonoid glycosyltransferase YjiC (YdhE family)
MVCPLDWGLGHASRMLPVISRFKKDGHRVIMAGTGRSGELLRTTFPELAFLRMPSPDIRLREGKTLSLGLMLQIPGLIGSVFREHRLVIKYVNENKIDIVVSDNRYGLFCRSAYTVFVTHQISPVLPGLFRWIEYPLYRIFRSIIGLYDECWIPDYEDSLNNLSGKLSHRYPLPKNARFIGILSRFSYLETAPVDIPENHYHIVAVLSGPEPQISVFEKLVRIQLRNIPKTALIIRGLRGREKELPPATGKKLSLVSHLETHRFACILRQADHVLCRSGYSGIMDLVALGIPAILVPTPGQSEQEYLSARLANKGWFNVIRQEDLNLSSLPEHNAKLNVPDFKGNLLQLQQQYFQDLYSKYSSNGKKPNHKT